MKPFVKWAGGKRQILNEIIKEFKDKKFEDSKYIEPFLGGGAVFFAVQPKQAIINDLNSDLINAYQMIKSDEYRELIDKLQIYSNEYKDKNTDKDEYYYEKRRLDRDSNFNELSNIDKAARMIFLNRTCYNGLYRVNNNGYFNTPIGRYANPLICDSNNLQEIHEYLSNNHIEIMCGGYEQAMDRAEEGDLIYIDPPYDYKDDDGFTKYQMSGFTFEDFINLKKKCDEALKKGATVVISNNATERVLKLFDEDPKYSIYFINKINTLRMICCKGEGRKSGEEVIITGVDYQLPQANNLESLIDVLAEGDENVLEDDDKMKSLLKVTTERQVKYYIAAMKYLNLVTNQSKFNDNAKGILGDKDKIEKYVYDVLLNKEEFSIGMNLDNPSAKKLLAKVKKTKKYDSYNENTLIRRFNSINHWLIWMKKYHDEILQKE